jgi:hypothetical protein
MVLLISGLIYLSGIAAMLWFRPSLMFHANGTWKEFGIGRGNAYTWLPFWLFAIMYALMSYIVVFSVSMAFRSPTTQSRRLRVNRNYAPVPAEPKELLPGYYMLNTPPVNNKGVPRYVYIGDTMPE